MAYIQTLIFENIYILLIKQHLRELFFKINKNKKIIYLYKNNAKPAV